MASFLKWLLSLFRSPYRTQLPQTDIPSVIPLQAPSAWMPPEAPAVDPKPAYAPQTASASATITRHTDTGKETLGTLIACNNGKTFTCDTLELGWHDNEHDISCIPLGNYNCSVRPFHQTKMYEILFVPNRYGVFVHPGNYYTDVLGCILLGIKPSDINRDGQIDVTSSQATVAAFMAFMDSRDFLLSIE